MLAVSVRISVHFRTSLSAYQPNSAIYMAAVNACMCGATTERADGLRLHPVFSPRNIDVVVNPAVAFRRADFALRLIAAVHDDVTLLQRKDVARQ